MTFLRAFAGAIDDDACIHRATGVHEFPECTTINICKNQHAETITNPVNMHGKSFSEELML